METRVSDDAARDWELVGRSAAGDLDAFDELVTKYQKKVYGIIFGIVHQSEDALDIAQEVFLKVFRQLGRFSGKSSFFTWLYRITVNMAIDHQRRKKRISEVEYDDEIAKEDVTGSAHLLRPELTPEEALSRKELSEIVLEAIELLPEEQRAVLTLREIEGLSYKEIARVLKCSTGTVMSRLHYGRRKLREKLRDYL